MFTVLPVAEDQITSTVFADRVAGAEVWDRRVSGPGRVMLSCSRYTPGSIRIVAVVLSWGRESMADWIVGKVLAEEELEELPATRRVP